MVSAVKVLIVHNDQNVVQVLSHLVTEIGYQPHPISDTELFPIFYKVCHPQIIIYKYGMDKFHGLELFRWLTEQNNTAKVILFVEEESVVPIALERLVSAADLFPVSILTSTSSREETLAALKF